MAKRRSLSDKFKAMVALEVLRGDKTAQKDCWQAQGSPITGRFLHANTERQRR